MRWVGEVFDGLGVTGQDRELAFPDGAAFRIEIPSVEGPRVLEAVQRAAEGGEEGIRSFLVADLGLLRAVTQAQARGALPAGLVWKVSAVIARRECAGMVVGGPTAVLDLGGLRIVSDPTFDAPGPHGYLTKTAGPAVSDAELGPVDLVLVSHDNHPDNLDDRGRSFALAAPLVLTTRSGAARLGHPAVGLPPGPAMPWTGRTAAR